MFMYLEVLLSKRVLRELFLCVLLLWTSAVVAAVPSAQPPVGKAHRLDAAPAIDGEVQADPAWHGALAFTNFWQTEPDEGQSATQKTEVFVGFTNDTLYIGVVLHDTNPEGIIVSSSQRDASLDETDSFQVFIDSFMDRQNGFVFGTNPAGIEYDAQVTREGSGGNFGAGSGFNLNWDTTWTVKAKISDIGWSAEMAIPFKSLRYGPEDVQSWGINFQRNIRRNNETAFWAPLSMQHDLYRASEAGTVEGIDVPSQKNLQVMPYVLGLANSGGALNGTKFDHELGVDIKYSITPSLTLDATYNTDFAQVEVDEFQVNLDRFSLFLPEQRPFFLENAGQFAVGSPEEVELFFSRRIGIGDDGEQIPIAGGVRVSGKLGDSTNVGFLQMRSDSVSGTAPRNDYSVARVSQELANRSSVGAIFVNRHGSGGGDNNTAYALDGRWGIGTNLTLSGFAAKTQTSGAGGDGHAFKAGIDHSSELWSSSYSYTEVDEEFNPEVGFTSRRGFRKLSGFSLRRIRPDNLWGLQELRPHISYRGFWDFDGFYETGFVHVDNHWEWKGGTEIHTGVNFTHEGVKEAFEIVDGVTVQPGSFNHSELAYVAFTNQGAPLSFSVRGLIGGFFGGDRFQAIPSMQFRMGDAFTSEISWSHNSIDLPVPNGKFDVDLARLRLTYSFTPKMSIQALVQYNKRDEVFATNFRFAWIQSANAGLYLVYNEVDDDGLGAPNKPRREFILKYSRIFNLLN